MPPKKKAPAKAKKEGEEKLTQLDKTFYELEIAEINRRFILDMIIGIFSLRNILFYTFYEIIVQESRLV